MKHDTVDKAVEFFYPFLAEEAYIIFYGGEPLLAFDTIEHTVACFQEKCRNEDKKLRFSITTNGSLLTDHMLRFFDKHQFNVTVSFDGLAQDAGRKQGTMEPLLNLTRQIAKGLYPGITFSTKSVFTPGTITHLSESIRCIARAGVTDISIDTAENMPWDQGALIILKDELTRLSAFLAGYYKETGTVPVDWFKQSKPEPGTESPGTFACAAGRKRMAISPAEDLWGCFVFHDYLKYRRELQDFHSYSFGKLDDFIREHGVVYPRTLFFYDALMQDYFFTDRQNCFLCEEVNRCGVCPVNAAYTTSSIGKISPWVCELHRLREKEKKRFLQEIERMGNTPGKPVKTITGGNYA
jgi:sulfatase maturation enzyme AslB (radical SAM superfamily)